MPYILISTQIRLECGPTVVGDADSDPELMKALEAMPSKQLGNNFVEYTTVWPPRAVLNKLETLGWKVVGMAGIGQTCAWTLHKTEDWSASA
uniref:GTP cyclohydrolase 1 feedback regulatory protein n=1 Tax=Plectus sambesii TaxID=2011161 RepID=A0A914WEP0_9BILA